MITSGGILLTVRDVSENVVEKIKTYILYSVNFPENRAPLRENVEKLRRAGQTTDVDKTGERNMRFS
jgi:hypothetical protein